MEYGDYVIGGQAGRQQVSDKVVKAFLETLTEDLDTFLTAPQVKGHMWSMEIFKLPT